MNTIRSSRWGLVALLLLAPAACQGPAPGEPHGPNKRTQPSPPDEPLPQPTLRAVAPATAADAGVTATGADEGGIPWHHDDYAAARAEAAAAKKPLVIDMWAPWCHTCLSMQHFVMSDPSIAAMADRYVWLALDTDREVNAAAVAVYPLDAWPTFFVVSAEAEKVEARLVGSATVREFRDFLERGARGALSSRGEAGGLDPGSAAAFLADGDRAVLAGDLVRASEAYAAAAAVADVGDLMPDVLVSAIGVLNAREAWGDCVTLGAAHLGDAARTRSAKVADFAAYAADCADHLDDPAAVLALRRQIVAEDSPVRSVLFDMTTPISIDDRADGLRILREVHDVLGEEDAGRALAEMQRALLEGAIGAAPDPNAAMTYNWPLSEVYARLGQPLGALPALTASAEALPDSYDPPYRIAWVMLQAGDARGALPHAERALSLAYGPRKARVQGLVADIQHALGDASAERAAREGVVAILAALPAGQARPAAVESAKKALADLDAPKAP